MDTRKAIEELSKIIDVSENQKEDLISRYSLMSDREAIKNLSEIAFRVLENNDNLYEQALNIIRSINPKISPSVKDMKDKLHKIFYNEIEGNMSLEENHKLINDSLSEITTLFNKNEIDYYIVGALPCFIKTGQPLFRYHDDIDIFINEKDISKASKIINSLGKYNFIDDRFPNLERYKELEQQKLPHTVMAQNLDNEFHLGFFCFKREQDNSITMREYSHRLKDGNVIVDVLERKTDPIGTSLRFDEEEIKYMGSSFKTSSVESVYSIKEYTKRPKDITDMQKLESYIDKEKLNQLKKRPTTVKKTEGINKNIFELDFELEEKKQSVTDDKIRQTINKHEVLLSELSEKELIDLQLLYIFKKLSTVNKATPVGGLSPEIREQWRNLAINEIERLSQINYPEVKDFDQIFNLSKNGSVKGRKILDSFKEEMIQIQSENVGYVYTALPVSGIQELNASKHRENQYYNDILDGVFAVSSSEGLKGYVARANVGGMIGSRDGITYPSNPFSEVNEQGAKLIKPVSVYLSNPNEFDPQFDFILSQDGKPHIIYDNEWVAKKEKVSCKETKVSSLPLSFIEDKNVYYKNEQGEEVQIKVKQNKTLTLNNQNNQNSSSNGFGYIAMLVAIVSFSIGILSTITYFIVASMFK